jgi:hypothetical protein
MVVGRFTTRYAMTQEWITDRLPTEADGDMDGNVWMRLSPLTIMGIMGFSVHWSYVGSAAPWRHTSYWQPPAEPAPTEPTPTEPDRIAALEQRVAELEARVFEQLGLIARLSHATAEAFQSLTARQ